MSAQGGGAIYNMGGWGSDGKRCNGLTVYGTTKRALRHFSRGLANRRHRAHFAWLSGARVMGRFLTAGFRKWELFADRPD